MKGIQSFGVWFTLLAATLATADDSGLNHVDIRMSLKDYSKQWLGAPKDASLFELATSSIDVQGKRLDLEKLKLRGQSCRSAKRKCLNVKSKKAEESGVGFLGVDPVQSSGFFLVSMWQDDGYISNKISFGLMNAVGMMNLKTNYAQVRLHHETTSGAIATENIGLYLVTESPVKVMRKRFESPLVIRRRYNGNYEIEHTNDQNSTFPQQYEELSKWAKKLHGQELYDRLSSRLDLDSYMRWLVFNKWVRNHDAQDELFFYADAKAAKSGKLFLKIFPWDYDDTFQDKPRGFMAMVKRILVRKSPLDKAIAKDPVLKAKYREIEQKFLGSLTDSLIDKVAAEVDADIAPYLRDDILGVSSTLDKKRTPHNAEYIRSLLDARVIELKTRREQMLIE